ncbi:hypothetical protein F4604DRAFT_1546278, partial [Suillus subluteus]
LLLYLGEGKIDDKTLPHRTRLTIMLLEEHKKEHLNMINNIKKSLGRVSTTMDLWSDPNQDSFMAVTAHFMMRDDAGLLILKSHLI